MLRALKSNQSGLTGSQISAIHGSFLSKCVFGCISKQGQAGSSNAQGVPWPRDITSAKEKATAVAVKLKEMILKDDANKV